jgi:uncharacterized membrane protein (UPF0127 family)
MTLSSKRGYAFNRTQQTFLANDLDVADSHWTRLKGLIGTSHEEFFEGRGLWIIPSHGVHTIAMRYPIDVAYLDSDNVVVHMEESVRPWRITPIRIEAESVLELPSRTLSNTRTKVGDRLEICVDSPAPANGQRNEP